jgi:hypothetical protein
MSSTNSENNDIPAEEWCCMKQQHQQKLIVDFHKSPRRSALPLFFDVQRPSSSSSSSSLTVDWTRTRRRSALPELAVIEVKEDAVKETM